MSIEKVLEHYLTYGVSDIKKIDVGNINETYLITERTTNNRLIFQKINKRVFAEPEKVMSNIMNVTVHLQNKYSEERQKNALKVINTLDGHSYFIDENSDYWRCYNFIADTYSVNKTDDLSLIKEAGLAFGEFQRCLMDLDETKLHVTIENFHNTKSRYTDLIKAITDDKCGRLKFVTEDVDFLMGKRRSASILNDLLEYDILPLRITHNDTKCSNVLFDNKNNKAVSVIDLDTVMPGLIAYDYGDGIRSICSTADEDEKDLTKVDFDMNKFYAFTYGYLTPIKDILTAGELQTLHYGITCVTLELAVRFLIDYLEGDVYFKTTEKDHNMFRMKNQIKLYQAIEDKFQDIERFVLNL